MQHLSATGAQLPTSASASYSERTGYLSNTNASADDLARLAANQMTVGSNAGTLSGLPPVGSGASGLANIGMGMGNIPTGAVSGGSLPRGPGSTHGSDRGTASEELRYLQGNMLSLDKNAGAEEIA